MANDLTINPLRVDTAGAGAIVTTPIRIHKIRWTGATTAGHTAVIRDQNNNHFWSSVASGANYVEESDFSTDQLQRNVINGLIVPTLGSGVLHIYEG